MTAKIFLGQTSQAQFAAQRQALYECAGSARVWPNLLPKGRCCMNVQAMLEFISVSLIIIIPFCLDTDRESGVNLTIGVAGQGQERQ